MAVSITIHSSCSYMTRSTCRTYGELRELAANLEAIDVSSFLEDDEEQADDEPWSWMTVWWWQTNRC